MALATPDWRLRRARIIKQVMVTPVFNENNLNDIASQTNTLDQLSKMTLPEIRNYVASANMEAVGEVLYSEGAKKAEKIMNDIIKHHRKTAEKDVAINKNALPDNALKEQVALKHPEIGNVFIPH